MRSTRLGRLAICLLASSLLPVSALAGGGPRDHRGFFLRLSGGIGSATTSISFDDMGNRWDWDLSGLSGDLNLAIGGAVAENLLLHGTLFGWTVEDPDFTVNKEDLGSIAGTLTMGALGGGLTYYLMPSNFYLSGSIGLAQLDFEEASTKNGFAVDLTVGKEWWVGDNWGLGLNGGAGFHSVPEKDIDGNWSDLSFHLRFSATMN